VKASDNEFPSVLFDEQGSDPATPSAGFWRLYTKAGGLYLIDDGGSVVGPFATAAGASDSFVKLTADETGVTNSTLVNTGLSFAVTNGVYYNFKFIVLWRSGSGTVGLKIGLTTPTFTEYSATVAIHGLAGDGNAEAYIGSLNTSGDSAVSTAAQFTTVSMLAVIEGFLLPSADGTLMVQYAAETTGSTVTMKKGSSGRLTTLP
jgi:hypothetical protein